MSEYDKAYVTNPRNIRYNECGFICGYDKHSGKEWVAIDFRDGTGIWMFEDCDVEFVSDWERIWWAGIILITLTWIWLLVQIFRWVV